FVEPAKAACHAHDTLLKCLFGLDSFFSPIYGEIMDLGKRISASNSVSALSFAMNATLFRLAAPVFRLAAAAGNVSAQIYDHYSTGYVNTIFMTGSNLFNNPLQSGSNALSQLFPLGRLPPPTSTTVSLWNPANSSFDTTSVFTNGAWPVNLPLPPGGWS